MVDSSKIIISINGAHYTDSLVCFTSLGTIVLHVKHFAIMKLNDAVPRMDNYINLFILIFLRDSTWLERKGNACQIIKYM